MEIIHFSPLTLYYMLCKSIGEEMSMFCILVHLEVMGIWMVIPRVILSRIMSFLRLISKKCSMIIIFFWKSMNTTPTSCKQVLMNKSHNTYQSFHWKYANNCSNFNRCAKSIFFPVFILSNWITVRGVAF